MDGSRLIPLGIVNKERGAKDEKAATGAQAPELFRLSTEKDAYNLPSSRFVMEGVPAISALKGHSAGLRLGERLEGAVISAVFRDKKQRADGSLEGGIEGGFLLRQGNLPD